MVPQTADEDPEAAARPLSGPFQVAEQHRLGHHRSLSHG